MSLIVLLSCCLKDPVSPGGSHMSAEDNGEIIANSDQKVIDEVVFHPTDNHVQNILLV